MPSKGFAMKNESVKKAFGDIKNCVPTPGKSADANGSTKKCMPEFKTPFLNKTRPKNDFQIEEERYSMKAVDVQDAWADQMDFSSIVNDLSKAFVSCRCPSPLPLPKMDPLETGTFILFY